MGCDRQLNDGLILKTTDRGNNWSVRTSLPNIVVEGVFFRNDNSGVAVGSGGTVLRTTDGGTSWILVPVSYSSTYPPELTSVTFTDSLNGLAVAWWMNHDRDNRWRTVMVRSDESKQQLLKFRASRKKRQWLGGNIAGNNCTILCRAFSPLAEKLWSWTGAVDSSWSTPGNWVPSTLPLPGDSVVIPDADEVPSLTDGLSKS